MKKEIKIIMDPSKNDNEKGEFFENLIRTIFETQRYKIAQRVNFTGMEIDLIAEHLDRNEIAYIECKAKEKLNSSEIKIFSFNTEHRKADYGYFLSTIEPEHQVAGLIEEIKKKDDKKNLYFWGPDKIFELLESSSIVLPFKNIPIDGLISKLILAYTYYGNFYVPIFIENTLPSKFTIFDAKKNLPIVDPNIIKKLKSIIDEIKDINYSPIDNTATTIFDTKTNIPETIAEIQESENWFDYLPASTKHFIGRKDLKSTLFDFLNQIVENKTSKRIFYIDGKSGWGKSSLLADLRGKSKNKFNSKKYFVYVVDARSASTSRFATLSFKKLVENATLKGFINSNRFSIKLDIISDYDILGSDSIKAFLKELNNQHKYLILVFDQFEDVFRKEHLFKVFHKFLLDVNESRSNFILGFSWKSEINSNYSAYFQILPLLTNKIRQFTSK